MALGLSRMQPRSTRPSITPPTDPAATAAQEQDWLSQRGAILFEATCDVVGGFPGFGDLGGELPDAAARISERFLIIDEGKPHGFGIPIGWLDGAALIARSDREDPDLRVFFSDGTAARCFTIRFRPNRLAMRGGKRAERAQDALAAAGLIDAAPGETPDFALSWDHTHEFDAEHVLWSSHASAPVHVGEELAPSEIWLSTESLIWGSSDGDGLNRVELSRLTDYSAVRLKDRGGTPAIYLAVTDDRFGRYEIPFVFDQQATPDRNFRERGAFVTGLQSIAVPPGNVAPLWQPWRLDVHPANRRPDVPTVGIAPSDESESTAPFEMPGVRARLESWLPKLHAFAGRSLNLPTVEEEKATVVAFPPAEPCDERSIEESSARTAEPSLDAGNESPLNDSEREVGADAPDAVGLNETEGVLAEGRLDVEAGQPTTPDENLPAEDITVASFGEDAAQPELPHRDSELVISETPALGEDAAPPDSPPSVQVADDVPVDHRRPGWKSRSARRKSRVDSKRPSIDDRQPAPAATPADNFAEATLLAEPQATFVLDFSVPAGEEFTQAPAVEDPSKLPSEAGPEDRPAPAHSEISIPVEAEPEPAPLPATRAQQFEAAALGVLADALQVIDVRLETGSLEPLGRTQSLSAARDAAFAEICALGAEKMLKKRDVRRQIERLTNLHDAGIRLRSLVELYDRGRLNNPELEHLRSKLVGNVVLSPVGVPLASTASETVRAAETFLGS